MIEWLETAVYAVASIHWLEWVSMWFLTLGFLMVAEIYFAKNGSHSKLFYKRLFDPFHWTIAFGPFLAFCLLAFHLKGDSGMAVAFVVACLSFFGTVSLLEKLHERVWSKFRSDIETANRHRNTKT